MLGNAPKAKEKKRAQAKASEYGVGKAKGKGSEKQQGKEARRGEDQSLALAGYVGETTMPKTAQETKGKKERLKEKDEHVSA